MSAETKIAEVGRIESATIEGRVALGLVLGMGCSILLWLWWLLE